MKRLSPSLAFSMLCLVFVAGCSSSQFRDRTADYGEAEAVEYPQLAELKTGDAMPIPASDLPAQARRGEVQRPEPLRVREADASLVEERRDEEGVWLFVERSPAEVWPALQGFASEQDLPVESSQPRQGVIRFSADQASQLAAQQIQLRQGVRRSTSEVRLGSVTEDGESLSLSEYDLTRLMALKNYLLVSLTDEDQRVSRQAQSLHAQQQLRLVDRDERLVLVFRLDYDRVWSELTRLLEDEFDDNHQQLNDLDRSAGRFYLRYVPQDERRRGFFARLFRRGPGADEHHYQLYLAEYSSELDLTLEVEPGQAAPVAVEEELLRWLERQLR